MVRLWVAVGLLLGWPVPAAAADPASVFADFDGSGCGIVAVTVHNPDTEDVTYSLTIAGISGQAVRFPLDAESSRDHRLRVFDGAVIAFDVNDIFRQQFTYQAGPDCPIARLAAEPVPGCVNTLVTATNTGTAAAPDVRIRAGTEVVASAVSLAPGQILTAVAAAGVNINVEQRADDATGAFYSIIDFLAVTDPPACRGHAVTVEDICTGVRIGVGFPDGQSELEKVVVDTAGGPTRALDVPPAGQAIDVSAADGALLTVALRFGGADVNAVFHRHTRPTSCTPSSPAPPTPSPSASPSPEPSPGPEPSSPSAPPPAGGPSADPPSTAPGGGGGGLPLTGASITTAGGVGVVLLALGCLALVVARRRRTAR